MNEAGCSGSRSGYFAAGEALGAGEAAGAGVAPGAGEAADAADPEVAGAAAAAVCG